MVNQEENTYNCRTAVDLNTVNSRLVHQNTFCLCCKTSSYNLFHITPQHIVNSHLAVLPLTISHLGLLNSCNTQCSPHIFLCEFASKVWCQPQSVGDWFAQTVLRQCSLVNGDGGLSCAHG